MLDQQNLVFSFLVADWSQTTHEVSLWVAGVTRPRVDRDDNPLIVQLRRLACLNPNSRDFSFSRNENVASRSLEDVRLDNAAVLTPLASDDADDFSGRLSVVFFAFFVEQRLGCLFMVNRVIGRIDSLVFENDFARRYPVLLGKNFNRDDVAIDGSVEGCTTLQKNLRRKADVE